MPLRGILIRKGGFREENKIAFAVPCINYGNEYFLVPVL